MSGLDTFLFYPQNTPRGAHLPERLDHWQKVLAAGSAAAFDRYGWGYAGMGRRPRALLLGRLGQPHGRHRDALRAGPHDRRALERESGEIVSTARRSTARSPRASRTDELRGEPERDLHRYVAHRRRERRIRPGRRARSPSRPPPIPCGTPTSRGRCSSRGSRSSARRRAPPAWGSSARRRARARSRRAPGSWAAQPQGAMVRTYLEVDPRLDADFLREERADLERGKGSRIYDVTAWNLAAQMGIDGAWIDAPTSLPSGRAGDGSGGRGPDLRAATRGSSRPGSALARFCARAEGDSRYVADGTSSPRRASGGRGVVGSVVGRSSCGGTRTRTTSTLSWRRSRRPRAPGCIARCRARSRGRRGSRRRALRTPRGAEGGDALEHALSPSDFGHVWRYVDEDLGLPVTLVDCQEEGSIQPLQRAHRPPGPLLPGERAEAMADWVRSGGTLIALDSSAFAIADGEFKLGSNRLRRDVLDDLDRYPRRVERERARERRGRPRRAWRRGFAARGGGGAGETRRGRGGRVRRDQAPDAGPSTAGGGASRPRGSSSARSRTPTAG